MTDGVLLVVDVEPRRAGAEDDPDDDEVGVEVDGSFLKFNVACSY